MCKVCSSLGQKWGSERAITGSNIILTCPFQLIFFPLLIFFKYVAFCTGFNLLTPIFMLPYIIMDLPIFVIAEWATLLVDIHCPRGGS